MEKEYGFLDKEEKEFVVLPKDLETESGLESMEAGYAEELLVNSISKAVSEMALSKDTASYVREEWRDEPTGMETQIERSDYVSEQPIAQEVQESSDRRLASSDNILSSLTDINMEEIKEEMLRLQNENKRLADSVSSMEARLVAIGNDMAKIADSSRLMANQLETVNNNLHKENQALKEGLYDSLILPILEDVIELSSDTMIDIQRYRKQENETAAKAMEDVLESIHLVLERHNVEVYQPQPGDPYEPIVQRLMKAVETTEEGKNKTIAKCSGSGYRFLKKHKEKLFVLKDEGNDQVLSPCKVYVYKYNK